MSANPTIASQQASRLFQSAEWRQIETQLKQSYQGLISGWQNGIKKVPAILFQYPGEESLVIYGETNVDTALKRLTSWQHQQKNKEGAK